MKFTETFTVFQAAADPGQRRRDDSFINGDQIAQGTSTLQELGIGSLGQGYRLEGLLISLDLGCEGFHLT